MRALLCQGPEGGPITSIDGPEDCEAWKLYAFRIMVSTYWTARERTIVMRELASCASVQKLRPPQTIHPLWKPSQVLAPFTPSTKHENIQLALQSESKERSFPARIPRSYSLSSSKSSSIDSISSLNSDGLPMRSIYQHDIFQTMCSDLSPENSPKILQVPLQNEKSKLSLCQKGCYQDMRNHKHETRIHNFDVTDGIHTLRQHRVQDVGSFTARRNRVARIKDTEACIEVRSFQLLGESTSISTGFSFGGRSFMI